MADFKSNAGGRIANVRVSFEDAFLGIIVIDDETGDEILDLITDDPATIREFGNDVAAAVKSAGV